MAGKTAPRRKSLKTKGKKAREKQKFIPGTEPVSIKEIEDVAEAYVDVRDKRMNLTEDESEFKTKLIEVMKKHNLETYNFNGYIVVRSHIDEDEVKVKKARAAKEDGSLA
jgi:hypothetical protein